MRPDTLLILLLLVPAGAISALMGHILTAILVLVVLGVLYLLGSFIKELVKYLWTTAPVSEVVGVVVVITMLLIRFI